MSTRLERLRETVAAAKAAEVAERAGGNGAGPRALPAAPGRPRVPAVPPEQLVRRREQAARRLAEAHWDLGGLAYEMAIRDHFRMDVLMRQAAVVQELDAELGQIDRLLRLDAGGAAGTCPTCHALHGRGAAYCWACGTALADTVGV